MILLVSASWPQRALIRAQLSADTQLEVIGADSCQSAVEWLARQDFAVVVVDTAGLLPDPRLIDAIQARRTPVLVLTSASNRTEWTEATAGLEVKEIMARPVFIGDVTRSAARLVIHKRGRDRPHPRDKQASSSPMAG